jgi:hypothetical protein
MAAKEKEFRFLRDSHLSTEEVLMQKQPSSQLSQVQLKQWEALASNVAGATAAATITAIMGNLSNTSREGISDVRYDNDTNLDNFKRR